MLTHYPYARFVLFLISAMLLGGALLAGFLSGTIAEQYRQEYNENLLENNAHSAAVGKTRLRDVNLHVSALAGLMGAQQNFSRLTLLQNLREPGVSKYFTRMTLLWEDGTWYFNCDLPDDLHTLEKDSKAGSIHSNGSLCPRKHDPEWLRQWLPTSPESRTHLIMLPFAPHMSASLALALAPVYHQGELRATLGVALPASTLYLPEDKPTTDNRTFSFMVDSEGRPLQGSNAPLPSEVKGQATLPGWIDSAETSSITPQELLQVLQRKAGKDQHGALLAHFTLKNGEHTLAVEPVGDSGWHMVTVSLPADPSRWLWCLQVLPLPLGIFSLLLLVVALRARHKARQLKISEQAALRQSLHSLMSCMPGASFCCTDNTDMTLVHVSPQLCELTGYTAEEIHDIFDNSYIRLVHEHDRACLGSIVQGAGDDVRTEYRMVRKDGQSLWVRDQRRRIGLGHAEGQKPDEPSSQPTPAAGHGQPEHHSENGQGTSQWHGVVMDISECIRLNEARQLEADRADILIDMAGSMLYDYSPIEGRVRTGKKMAELFDIANPPFVFDRPGLDTNCIHPDDIATYMCMRTRMLSGANACDGTLRIRDLHGGNQWYHVRMRAVMDAHGRCAHIVGHLSDAYDSNDLPHQRKSAQHDVLTGLLSNDGIRGRANAYIAHCEPDIVAALCLIEVSNLSHISHHYGGLIGEELLTKLAQGLRGIFRPTDLLARLEKERFAVLVKDMRDKQGLLQKMERIRETCTVEARAGNESVSACVHIGVSFFPMQGRSFEQLHTYAETALLSAHKENSGIAVYT